MILETTRLRIILLEAEQFGLLLQGLDKLEKELNLAASDESLDADTQEAMEILYTESLLHLENYYWYTNWQIILKSENKAIGSACFMKEPDNEGKVEIGYGINKTYRSNEYMTETINCMCRWAFSQQSVKWIIAETEIDNYSSQKVLEKLGMEKYRYTDNSIWWRINKS